MANSVKVLRLRNAEKVDFPKIRRKKSRKAILRDYLSFKETATENTTIGKSTFMLIINRITSGQQHQKQCVDYCLGVLLFENLRLLEYVVKRRCNQILEQKKLMDQIAAI